MKLLLKVLLLCGLCVVLTGCFSLMKADRLIYAGSIGKKIDAVLVDSLDSIDTRSNYK